MPIEGIVACGGLPFQNRLLMQLTADITGRDGAHQRRPARRPRSGSAMFGAVAAGAAAGGYDTITDAAARMAHLGPDVYRPAAGDRAAWDEGYAIYRELHDSMARQDSADAAPAGAPGPGPGGGWRRTSDGRSA